MRAKTPKAVAARRIHEGSGPAPITIGIGLKNMITPKFVELPCTRRDAATVKSAIPIKNVNSPATSKAGKIFE